MKAKRGDLKDKVNFLKILKVFSKDELPKTFMIFYAVGLLLYIIPFSRPLFVALTPLSLFFVTLLVVWHHKKIDFNFIIFSVIVVVSSFFIEVIGVRSGELFGNYRYLPTLGPGIMDTPVVIGVNWLMLTYCSAAIVNELIKKSGKISGYVLKIISGAAIMVIYDLVVEMVAPAMGMWQFETPYPPVRNFIMWFIISLTFHSLLHLFKIKATGKPAISLFVLQIIFFLLVFLVNL
jgi:uncharacterized membrane protein